MKCPRDPDQRQYIKPMGMCLFQFSGLLASWLLAIGYWLSLKESEQKPLPRSEAIGWDAFADAKDSCF